MKQNLGVQKVNILLEEFTSVEESEVVDDDEDDNDGVGDGDGDGDEVGPGVSVVSVVSVVGVEVEVGEVVVEKTEDDVGVV